MIKNLIFTNSPAAQAIGRNGQWNITGMEVIATDNVFLTPLGKRKKPIERAGFLAISAEDARSLANLILEALDASE